MRHKQITQHPSPSIAAAAVDGPRNPGALSLVVQRLHRLVTVAALAAVTVAALPAADVAEAARNNPVVKVAGKVTCANQGRHAPKPGVLIQLNNGETGGNRANGRNNYGIQFRRIPASGVSGTVIITCHEHLGPRNYRTTIRVARQPVRGQMTFNLHQVGGRTWRG